MADLIKLTDNNGCTGTTLHCCERLLWGAGVRHQVDTDGTTLCTNQLIHAYENRYIAVLMNEIHASYSNYRMWRAKGGIVISENGLKCGVKSLLVTDEIPREFIPIINTADRIKIAVLINALWITQNLDNSAEDFEFLKWSLRYLKEITRNIPEMFVGRNKNDRYAAIEFARHNYGDISGTVQTYGRLLKGYNVANLIVDCLLHDHGYAISQIQTAAGYNGKIYEI